VRSTLFEATSVVGMAPVYYAYNLLLCILQVLHVFWFLIIVRMAKCYIVDGKVAVCNGLLFFCNLYSSFAAHLQNICTVLVVSGFFLRVVTLHLYGC